jgi:excisionase family DNA binding protein
MGVSPTDPTPGYLSVKEAAAELGISSRWAYHLIRSGRLRAERVPGSGGWRIPRRSLWVAVNAGPRRVSLEEVYDQLLHIRRLLEAGADRCQCCGKPTAGER